MGCEDMDEGRTGVSILERVVTGVATHEGTDPLALEPLHSAVDPDALAVLFAHPHTSIDHVTFEYHGYRVVVEGVDAVHIEPLDES